MTLLFLYDRHMSYVAYFPTFSSLIVRQGCIQILVLAAADVDRISQHHVSDTTHRGVY
jgi:hypothetical protein